MSGLSVNLTTLFSWASLTKWLNAARYFLSSYVIISVRIVHVCKAGWLHMSKIELLFLSAKKCYMSLFLSIAVKIL